VIICRIVEDNITAAMKKVTGEESGQDVGEIFGRAIGTATAKSLAEGFIESFKPIILLVRSSNSFLGVADSTTTRSSLIFSS
jgi:hypothetical protein